MYTEKLNIKIATRYNDESSFRKSTEPKNSEKNDIQDKDGAETRSKVKQNIRNATKALKKEQ